MLMTPTQFDRWVLPVEVRDADDAWVHPRRLMILTSVTKARRSSLSGNVKWLVGRSKTCLTARR